MSALTHGFDLVAQISEEVCEYLFQTSYWSNAPANIPSFVSETNPTDPVDIVELYLGQPTLEFIRIGEPLNWVRLRIRLIARIFPETEEIWSDVTAIMTLVISPDDPQQIVVNFASVPDQFALSPHVPAALAERFRPLLVKTLHQTLRGKPVLPRVEGTMGFFTFRTYEVTRSSRPVRFLAVFINRDTRPGTAPATMPAWVERDNSPPPKPGIAVGIPDRIVLPAIGEALASQGFDPPSLPRKSPDDDSITINALTITLRSGAVHIGGNATKSLPVLPDPTVDFEVWVQLWFQEDTLTVNVLRTSADLPWWLSLLHFLAPFVGTVILTTVERAIPAAISKAVGGVAQSSLSEAVAFGSTLPNTNAVVRIQYSGGGLVSPDGLVVPARAEAVYVRKPARLPEYIYGNRDTREFHLLDCAAFKAMSRTRRVPFINPRHALQNGYNGCAWCLPQYDLRNPGRTEFRVSNPSGGNFSWDLTGRRTESLVLGDITVQPGINLVGGHFGRPPIWHSMATGEWTFAFAERGGAWRAECTVHVPSVRSRGTLYLHATRGKTSCTHQVGTPPEFP